MLQPMGGYLLAVQPIFANEYGFCVNQKNKENFEVRFECLPRCVSLLTGQSTSRQLREASRDLNSHGTAQPKLKSVLHSCRRCVSYSFSSCFLTYRDFEVFSLHHGVTGSIILFAGPLKLLVMTHENDQALAGQIERTPFWLTETLNWRGVQRIWF